MNHIVNKNTSSGFTMVVARHHHFAALPMPRLILTPAVKILLGISILLPLAACVDCEAHCERVPCNELSGNAAAIMAECRGCNADSHACAPGTPGYPSLAAAVDALVLAEERLKDQPAAASDVHDCAHLNGPDLRAMDPEARADALRVPTLVRNLTEGWPSDHGWLRYFAFDDEHPETPPDTARQEARSALQRIFWQLYGPPSPFDQRTQRLRVSKAMATGSGVSFCYHGFAWLALLEGEKAWFFASPGSPRPQPPSCMSKGAADAQPPPPDTTHGCVQRPGEVLVVPTGWWHATCNFGATFAFGGEDDCDVRSCHEGERSIGGLRDVCADTALVAACHGPLGDESRREYAERLRVDGSRSTAKGELEQSIMTVQAVDSGVWKALVGWRDDKDEL